MTEGKNICGVCGYEGLYEPMYSDTGGASFEICPCCGTEFGYNDCGASHMRLRMAWIDAGMPWWRESGPPEGYDPVKQLENTLMLPVHLLH